MLGLGALGEFALGQGPTPSGPFTQSDFAKSVRIKSSAFVILGSSAVLLAATPFTNLPQAQARTPKQPVQFVSGVNLSLLTPFIPRDFSSQRVQKRFARDKIYPNLVLSNFSVPFTPIDWSRPRSIKPSQVPVLNGFHILHQPIVDLHDGGVFVKRKSKRKDWRDPIELELEEKAARRAAIELAIYGPEVEYKEPPTVFAAPPPAPPDVGDLAKVVAAAQAAQFQDQRSRDEHDEEDDLESILREIL
jgi:hypothetical protein